MHGLHSFAAFVSMNLAYGRTTPVSYSDREVEEVNKCLGRLGLIVKPGGNPVDTFPILRYVSLIAYVSNSYRPNTGISLGISLKSEHGTRKSFPFSRVNLTVFGKIWSVGTLYNHTVRVVGGHTNSGHDTRLLARLSRALGNTSSRGRQSTICRMRSRRILSGRCSVQDQIR